MKVLVIAPSSNGDNISNALPVARVLSENHEVHGVFTCVNGYRLLRETPFFDRKIIIGDWKAGELSEDPSSDVVDVFDDLQHMFPDYDKVYFTNVHEHAFFRKRGDKSLWTNVVKQLGFEGRPNAPFRPILKLKDLGLEYKSGYIELDISWYDQYRKDFQCGPNSVLLHCESSKDSRTYRRPQELAVCLERSGFDVRAFDIEEDVRTNLHLVHQVAHVLTVDTFALWMAKCLRKEPYVFVREYRVDRVGLLGCENLVPNYEKINHVPPELIAERFVKAVEERKLSLI